MTLANFAPIGITESQIVPLFWKAVDLCELHDLKVSYKARSAHRYAGCLRDGHKNSTFSSHLNDRKKRTSINNNLSSWRKIFFGVSQLSVFGP